MNESVYRLEETTTQHWCS